MTAIVAHAPYTLNPCAVNPRARSFAQQAFCDDLQRLQEFPMALYNLHPGCHVGQGIAEGLDRLVDFLRDNVPEDCQTVVLLETMAGKGSELGGDFSQLRYVIDRVPAHVRLGVCLDTCHVSDGGYDIAGDLDGVLEEFDKVIGLGRLKAIHLNDSMNPLGSHKDRHQKLGEGTLGLEALERIINHPALRELPFYLETPNDLAGYAREIAMMKEAYQG